MDFGKGMVDFSELPFPSRSPPTRLSHLQTCETRLECILRTYTDLY